MQIKAVDNRRLVSSSLDQTMAVWKQDEGKHLALLRGNHQMSIHALKLLISSKDLLTAFAVLSTQS